jgi:ribonucleoside-diphosphate reductase alpha chain
MGLGVTGVANAAEMLGLPYGSEDMIWWCHDVMTFIRDECYKASIGLAKDKGPFPLFKAKEFLESDFAVTLPTEIRDSIREHGIRNSHLLSIAPTGTISLFAGNVSSGIEPPFSLEYKRNTVMPDGSVKEWNVLDYAYDQHGIIGTTSDQLSAKDHIDVLCTFSNLVDSACSKTCNVGDDVPFEEFKDLYRRAYIGGASGCTTFRPASIETRGEVMRIEKEPSGTCFINEYGERECAD